MNKYDRINKILTIFDVLDEIDSIPDFDVTNERIDFLHKIDATVRESIDHYDYDDAEENSNTTNSLATSVVSSGDDGDDSESPAFDAMPERQKLETPLPMKVLRDAENPLEVMSDSEFSRDFRFSKNTVQDILKMLSYGLAKSTNRGQPVSPICELLITLRFLATGSYQTNVCKNVSQPTLSRILKRVTTLLSEQRLRFIKIPERNEFKRIAGQFMQRGGCPEVFGCIGSTHIAIKSPGRNLSDSYLNEMGYYSFRNLVSHIQHTHTEREAPESIML